MGKKKKYTSGGDVTDENSPISKRKKPIIDLGSGENLLNSSPINSLKSLIGPIISDLFFSNRNRDEALEIKKSNQEITKKLQLAGSGKQENFVLPKLKSGGKVKGKGGPKSDSIKAKVDTGGFVVPAENAKQAEQLRALFFPDTKSQTANIKEGNQEVKLSDGEHYFTPQEVAILRDNQVNLDVLAPNANGGKGKAEGGKVTVEGKEINIDNLRKGKDKDGNDVIFILDKNGKATDLITDPEQVKSISGLKGVKSSQGVDTSPTEIISELNKIGTQDVKPAIKITDIDKVADSLSGITTPQDKTQGKSVELPKRNATPEIPTDLIVGPELSSGLLDSKPDSKEFERSKSPTITDNRKEPLSIQLSPMEKKGIAPITQEIPKKLEVLDKAQMEKISNELLGKTADEVIEGEQRRKKFLENLDIESVLSGTQVGVGAIGLLNQGDEPRLERNTDLINRFDEAREDEKRGFDSAEKAALNDKVQTNKNTGLKLARDFSGGNRFSAFSNASAVLSIANQQERDIAAKDSEIKRAKQFRTDRLLGAVDRDNKTVVASDQEIFRRNESVFANLLNAGISNFLGNKELKRIDKRSEERNKKTV